METAQQTNVKGEKVCCCSKAEVPALNAIAMATLDADHVGPVWVTYIAQSRAYNLQIHAYIYWNSRRLTE